VQKKLRVSKTQRARVSTKSPRLNRRQQIAQNKVELHRKGTPGQVAKGVWYIPPEGKTARALLAEQEQTRKARQAAQHAANFRRKTKKSKKTAQGQTRHSQTKRSEKKAKELKKLQKKVKECKKIQEAKQRGEKLEKNQLEKLENLPTYVKQIESYGKRVVDNEGFKLVC